MSVYVKTVEELINHLQTLPKDFIVYDDDSGGEGLYVETLPQYNMVMVKGVWDQI